MAIIPDSAREQIKPGHEFMVESGAGVMFGCSDEAYWSAGIAVVHDATALSSTSDVVVKVRPPQSYGLDLLDAGQTLISFFYPAQNGPLLEQAVGRGVNTIAMDMVPRISRAEKINALSPMAGIGGYSAVIEAVNNFGRFFTGQATAAGKVPPAKVLVIWAGVMALVAIGTATSLGAITLAFDVRPAVAEQIDSMEAHFVYLDVSDQQDGSATGGYAAPTSPEFRDRQLSKFWERTPQVDIVITTALIPGRDAPKLLPFPKWWRR